MPEWWQPFAAACERHLALMQGVAAGLSDAGQEGGSQALFEHLKAWQQAMGGEGADPFAVPGVGPGIAETHAGRTQLAAMQRLAALQARVLELQGRMMVHGADIAREAMQCFAARVAQMQEPVDALHEAWVDCAEQAYATRVHREDYCRAQAELANAVNALRLEQHRQAEAWARTLDLPTRAELDALLRRVRALEEARPVRESGKSGKAGKVGRRHKP